MIMDSKSQTRVKMAVVTGQHPYDVMGFQAIFRGIPGLDSYPQSLEEFSSDTGSGREQYDVILFYIFHQSTPRDASAGKLPWMEQGVRPALEQLGIREQGIFVLHHALLAFPEWQLWSDLCGIQNRRFGFHPRQTLSIAVAAPDHPVTKGLTSWEMQDETYTMDDADADSEILLTTQHPLSMHTIAWTRQYRRARVLCLQSGHDNLTYGNPYFRAIVARGIH